MTAGEGTQQGCRAATLDGQIRHEMKGYRRRAGWRVSIKLQCSGYVPRMHGQFQHTRGQVVDEPDPAHRRTQQRIVGLPRHSGQHALRRSPDGHDRVGAERFPPPPDRAPPPSPGRRERPRRERSNRPAALSPPFQPAFQDSFPRLPRLDAYGLPDRAPSIRPAPAGTIHHCRSALPCRRKTSLLRYRLHESWIASFPVHALPAAGSEIEKRRGVGGTTMTSSSDCKVPGLNLRMDRLRDSFASGSLLAAGQGTALDGDVMAAEARCPPVLSDLRSRNPSPLTHRPVDDCVIGSHSTLLLSTVSLTIPLHTNPT